jgi:hypothetical protein
VAAAAALLAGAGLSVLLAGGAVPSADAWRAARLAHAHVNLLGWVGLAVIGTQFTLWPTVLRTRMVPGLQAAARPAFLLTVGGLAVATAGLLARQRAPAVAGLAAYAAGLAAPWSRSPGRCCAAGRTRPRRGCSPPGPPGSPSRSSPTLPHCWPARGWSTSTRAPAG